MTVAEPLGIEADDFTTVGDNPETITLDQRRTADTLFRVVDVSPHFELFGRMLPEKLPIRLTEGQEAPEVDVVRIAFQISGAVVGGAEHLAAGDHGATVALAAEFGHPLDMLGRLALPLAGSEVETAHVPFDG